MLLGESPGENHAQLFMQTDKDRAYMHHRLQTSQSMHAYHNIAYTIHVPTQRHYVYLA